MTPRSSRLRGAWRTELLMDPSLKHHERRERDERQADKLLYALAQNLGIRQVEFERQSPDDRAKSDEQSS